jgi:hypothetical protein
MVDLLADGEFEEDKQYYLYTDVMISNCRGTDVGRKNQRFLIANHAQTYSSSFWVVVGDSKCGQCRRLEPPVNKLTTIC